MLRLFYTAFAVSLFILLGKCSASKFFAVATSRQCNAESISISLNSKVSTEITFVNRQKKPIRTYWLDYSGKRKFYSKILTGERVVQQTYVTHPWVVVDTLDNCLGLYYPDGQPRIVEIKPK